jgi:putative oxidoreductase
MLATPFTSTLPFGVAPLSLDHALALIRVVAGLMLAGHGAQKVLGWFGGYGPRGVAGWFGSMGIPAPLAFAWLVGLCELVGGICFALGLLTPLAALAITLVMLGAIFLVHWPHGLWNSKNGFEYPFLLFVIAAAIGLAGPGAYALDPTLGIHLAQPAIYITGLIIELVGLAVIAALRGQRVAQQGATATS